MFSSLGHFVSSLPAWVVLAAGVITGSIKSMWTQVYDHSIGWLGKKISLSVIIEDTQHKEAYQWVSFWVESRLRERKINSVVIRRNGSTKRHYRNTSARVITIHFEEPEDYSLMPGYGTYYIRHPTGLPMVVTHTCEKIQGDGGPTTRGPKVHNIEIKIWFSRDRNLLISLIEDARREYLNSLTPTVTYYRYRSYNGWDEGEALSKRPFESIYLREGLLDDVVSDMQTFLTSKHRYNFLNIPYRRGYLLEGPPGTGKSSLILALASHFNLPTYALSVAKMDGENLESAMTDCTTPCIMVFEDVDTLKVAVSREQSSGIERLTMSDFLNCIDGIGASEGRIVFMTSNHPEVLDDAVVRAGRIDRSYHIGHATDRELKMFYDRLSSQYPVCGWPEFRRSLPDIATIADAQAVAFRGLDEVRDEQGCCQYRP